MSKYSIARVGIDYPQGQICDGGCQSPLGNVAVRTGLRVYTGNKDGSGNRSMIICISCAVAKMNTLAAPPKSP